MTGNADAVLDHDGPIGERTGARCAIDGIWIEPDEYRGIVEFGDGGYGLVNGRHSAPVLMAVAPRLVVRPAPVVAAVTALVMGPVTGPIASKIASTRPLRTSWSEA